MNSDGIAPEPPNYCGCCGRYTLLEWCKRCRSHVGKSGVAWERTYFALTGLPCPFEIGQKNNNGGTKGE